MWIRAYPKANSGQWLKRTFEVDEDDFTSAVTCAMLRLEEECNRNPAHYDYRDVTELVNRR